MQGLKDSKKLRSKKRKHRRRDSKEKNKRRNNAKKLRNRQGIRRRSYLELKQKIRRSLRNNSSD
jgi:hypothetical protein